MHWWDFKGKIVSFQVHNKELITVLINFDSFISNKDMCDAVWYYWYCYGTDKLLWYWTYEWQKCQITNSDMSLYDNHVMVILIGYFPVRVSYKKAIYCAWRNFYEDGKSCESYKWQNSENNELINIGLYILKVPNFLTASKMFYDSRQ